MVITPTYTFPRKDPSRCTAALTGIHGRAQTTIQEPINVCAMTVAWLDRTARGLPIFISAPSKGMLRQVVHPQIVQESLGHAKVGTTLDIYSHVTQGLQQAAALRFEEGLMDAKQPERTVEPV